jgi:hypothetical protein
MHRGLNEYFCLSWVVGERWSRLPLGDHQQDFGGLEHR